MALSRTIFSLLVVAAIPMAAHANNNPATACGAAEKSVSDLNSEVYPSPLSQGINLAAKSLGFGPTLCPPELAKKVLLERLESNANDAYAWLQGFKSNYFMANDEYYVERVGADKAAEELNEVLKRRELSLRTAATTVMSKGTPEQTKATRELLQRIIAYPAYSKAFAQVPEYIGDLQASFRLSSVEEMSTGTINFVEHLDLHFDCMQDPKEFYCERIRSRVVDLVRNNLGKDSSGSILSRVFAALDQLKVALQEKVDSQKETTSMEVQKLTQPESYVRSLKEQIASVVVENGSPVDLIALYELLDKQPIAASAAVAMRGAGQGNSPTEKVINALEKVDRDELMEVFEQRYIRQQLVPPSMLTEMVLKNNSELSQDMVQGLLSLTRHAFQTRAGGWMKMMELVLGSKVIDTEQTETLLSDILKSSKTLVSGELLNSVSDSQNSTLKELIADHVGEVAYLEILPTKAPNHVLNLLDKVSHICEKYSLKNSSLQQVCRNEIVSHLEDVRDKYYALITAPTTSQEVKDAMNPAYDAVRLAIRDLRKL